MSCNILEILGSGGATTIPKPMCDCRICEQAREKWHPYKRTGPSYFLHGQNILFDTPEEIKAQVRRIGITCVNHVFYSHFHPDHTAGCRIWESANKGGRMEEGVKRTTNVYLPVNTVETMEGESGPGERLRYMEDKGYIRIHHAALDAPQCFGAVSVTPFQLHEAYAAGFDIRYEDRRILLIPDETYGWEPKPEQRDCDTVIMPMGVMVTHPLTGEPLVRPGYFNSKREPSFDFTLKLVEYLRAKRVILSHIEEGTGLSYDDYCAIQEDFQRKGMPIEFAYDGMKIAL